MRGSIQAARSSASSLRTTDREPGKRSLAGWKQQRITVDPAKSKMTLAELCDRYPATIQHQKPKTVERKSGTSLGASNRIGRADRRVQVSKIKPTDIQFVVGPVQIRRRVAQSSPSVG